MEKQMKLYTNMTKPLVLFVLVAMGSLSAWAADSKPGHWLYFKNTNKAWTNVYLRIGRADHVYTKPFTRIGASDWWKCETPDYKKHLRAQAVSRATTPITRNSHPSVMHYGQCCG